MTEQAYLKLFERKLVHHCTPTLAGIKPANMFVCRDESVPNLGASESELVAPETHERNLIFALRGARAKLASCGVRIEVLARRKSGALLYVYRPTMLAAELNKPQTKDYLEKCGYDMRSIASCIELLHKRICGTDLQSILSGSCSFPHEIGFFLGYPYEDVVGFIENEGENYLCAGCWKVYSAERDAKDCFCRYKECTAAYEGLFDEGVSLERLASIDENYPAEEAFPQAV